MDKLHIYEALLKDWQQRMNLVGPATLDHVWSRHFADSAQLAHIVGPGRKWLDIGAGGGFPGLVLAAMDWGQFFLVDSVAKKCRFLEAAVEAMGLNNVTVICDRVERLRTLGVDVATARAAAPLADLFDWSLRHVRPGGQYVFPKGRNYAAELKTAESRFSFDYDLVESQTEPGAHIIVARNLGRRRK